MTTTRRGLLGRGLDQLTALDDRDARQVDLGLVSRIGGKYLVTTPKTKRSRREVTLTPRAAEAMKRHRTAQKEARLLVGGAW